MTSLPFEDLPPADADLFDVWWPIFWTEWPHKVDKQEAMREFRKALRTTDPDKIIAGERNYIRAKPDWQAWMGPAKFLRRQRWEDEYTSNPSGRLKPDPALAWQHKAAMAKTSWGRHNVPRQDKEELHRMGLLTDEELAEALR